jgi:NAD(P)-dependent dehydrogenase (short-subunit alcohol dehydrogenase family)
VIDLARAGFDVAIVVRRADRSSDEVLAEVDALGANAVVLTAELADAGSVARLIPAATAALGPVTLLVNNASMFVYDDIATLTLASFTEHHAVNLAAPVLLAQAFAAHLPPDRQGVIVNIIDQRVWKPTPHFFSYATAKAGLWAATVMLAQALAPRIRVNAIGPGPVLKSVHQTAADFEAQCRAVPLQHGTSLDEIAAAIRYIVDARSMTGQMIALDGGQHIAWSTPDVGNGRG